MTLPPRIPDHSLDQLIDPELRREIGDPLPVSFAASVIYWPLWAVGLAASWWWTKSLQGPGYALDRILLDLLIGAGSALVITGSTFGLARRSRALYELEVEFRRVLGSMTGAQILRLAALSGTGEELVFRGTLQVLLADERFLGLGPWPGLIWTSLVFGALHFLPHRVFLPWTLFALFVGTLAGVLFLWRGSLVAPMTLHVVLNALNLRLIISGRRLEPDRIKD